MSEKRFRDAVAVVTGVNDKGIGSSIVDRLVKEGANVVALWQDEPVRLMERLSRKDMEITSLQCDVTVQSQVDSVFQKIEAEFGRIDVLVNNAGVDHSGEFLSTEDETWHNVIDVNLTGAMRVIRAAFSLLTENRATIVNVASVLGIAGCAGFPAYSATKAGLVGLTQSLAAELAPRGIRAVCVAPALVKTPMLKKYLKIFDDDLANELKRSHPLGIGAPQDVAAAIAFLASQDARWITGVTLPLGWSSSFPLPAQMFTGREVEEAVPSPLPFRQLQDENRNAESPPKRKAM